MAANASPPIEQPCVAPPPEAEVARLAVDARTLAATLRTAEALARGARRLDLRGLDGQADRLCKSLLSLPTGRARLFAPHLEALLSRLDALLAALTERAE